jgi:hypothetical protein
MEVKSLKPDPMELDLTVAEPKEPEPMKVAPSLPVGTCVVTSLPDILVAGPVDVEPMALDVNKMEGDPMEVEPSPPMTPDVVRPPPAEEELLGAPKVTVMCRVLVDVMIVTAPEAADEGCVGTPWPPAPSAAAANTAAAAALVRDGRPIERDTGLQRGG